MRTARGFTIVRFKDLYGSVCSMQKSSLATQDAIWLGPSDAEPMILASRAAAFGVETNETSGWVSFPIPDEVFLTTRMHLSRKQAAALAKALNHFAETGDVPSFAMKSWRTDFSPKGDSNG